MPIFTGYWKSLSGHESYPESGSLLDPRDYVDESWDVDERAQIVRLLKAGTPYESWRGYSYCRFQCGERNMGTHCFTADGSWVWPEGFAHYVEKHGVRPNKDFIGHLLSLPKELVSELESRVSRINAISDKWEKPWISGEGCKNMGGSCSKHEKHEGWLNCVQGYSSNRCILASQASQREYAAERDRHYQAIKPFLKYDWSLK